MLLIAVCDGRHDFGNATHLIRQVRSHKVDVIGQVFPRPGDAFHNGLPTQLSFHADLARYTSDFIGKRRQLIDHRINRVFQFKNFAFYVHGDLLAEVASSDRGGNSSDVAHLGR
jgi:hypothetical protein